MAWEGGTWRTTSPARLRPPVVSRSISQGTQFSPSKASQARGGHSGSTPMPSTWQSKRRHRAQRGTAADRPIMSTSSGTGWGEKHWNGDSRMASVWLRHVPPVGTDVTWVISHGTMSSWSVVVKATDDPTASVRGVATSTPRGTTTGFGCGADNQNVTDVLAAVGGKRWTPISSRNLM